MIERADAKQPDIGRLMREHEPITEALERARISTILRHRRMGVPLAVWRDGQVCIVPADEIRLPGEEEPALDPPGT